MRPDNWWTVASFTLLLGVIVLVGQIAGLFSMIHLSPSAGDMIRP